MRGRNGSTNPRSNKFFGILSVVLLMTFGGWMFGRQNLAFASETGTLKLSIVEGTQEHPTPARLELLDREGKAYFADDAFLFDQPVALLQTIQAAKTYFADVARCGNL